MTTTPTPATPSVSVESEERKPWPKGCIGYMPDYQAGGDCVNCGRVREDHAEFAAPAPNPSPAAKSGEAGLRGAREMSSRALTTTSQVSIPGDGKRVILATPSPQPADAVREALNLAWAVVSHADAAGFDASVFEDCSPGFCRDFHDLRHRLNTLPSAALTEPAPAGEVVEPDDPNLWHFWNEKARWLAAKLATTERDRDDARKALETAAEDERDRLYEKAFRHSVGMTAPERVNASGAVKWLRAEEKAMHPEDRAAARSASREATR